jgi:hypothetical protein
MSNTNNTLIAQFMGAKKTDISGMQKPIWYPINGKSIYEKDLSYHKSWDLLIPVLNQINTVVGGFDFESHECQKFEEFFDTDYVFSDIMRGDIDSLYNRVIEFLTWYNKYNNGIES